MNIPSHEMETGIKYVCGERKRDAFASERREGEIHRVCASHHRDDVCWTRANLWRRSVSRDLERKMLPRRV